MSAAVQLVEPDQVEETEQADRRVFATLVREQRELGHDSYDNITASLIATYGRRLFDELDDEGFAAVVRHEVAANMAAAKSTNIAGSWGTRPGPERAEAVFRLAAVGHAYWTSVWKVGVVEKETQDLTTADLEWLLRDRLKRIVQAKGQALFVKGCLDLARTHKVKKLGELKAKGISLPTIELGEDE